MLRIWKDKKKLCCRESREAFPIGKASSTSEGPDMRQFRNGSEAWLIPETENFGDLILPSVVETCSKLYILKSLHQIEKI